MKLILIIIAILFISCTDEPKAKEFLIAQGYTDIKFTGFDFLANNKNAMSSTGFTAINAIGQYVKGAVVDNGFTFFKPELELKIWEVR